MTPLANPPVRRVETLEPALRGFTHDDFMRLAPENQKAELIEGMLIVMPPPSYIHERLQIFLLTVIKMFVDYFTLGHVLGSRTAVRIDLNQTYEPDLLFVHLDRAHIIADNVVLEAPDLVIEIISGSTAKYDRGVKRDNYEKAGVRELWRVDPYGPTGTQFFQRQGSQLIEVTPADGVFHSAVLPNFNFKVAWLWPAANEQLANPIQVLKELGVKI